MKDTTSRILIVALACAVALGAGEASATVAPDAGPSDNELVAGAFVLMVDVVLLGLSAYSIAGEGSRSIGAAAMVLGTTSVLMISPYEEGLPEVLAPFGAITAAAGLFAVLRVLQVELDEDARYGVSPVRTEDHGWGAALEIRF
jgi:hypothetical protein